MLRHPARAFWLTAIIVLIADQAAKAAVRASFAPGDSIALIGDVLRLTYVRNVGAAFGMFPGYQPIFMATSAVVLLVVFGYWRKAHPTAWPVVIALGLVVGGAVGNLIDRAFMGRVTDFVDVAIIDFPVFNIADSAIVVGVLVLIAWLLFVPEEQSVSGDGAEAAEAAPDRDAESGEEL